MKTETIEAVKESRELSKIVEASGLEAQTSNYIKQQFMPLFDQAEEWKVKAAALVVTDINQKEEMKLAREARLALKEIRINADKTRKSLKEDSLRYGKAVQGVYNVIEYLIAPIEKHLEEQEKFAEIQAAKEKAARLEVRINKIAPFNIAMDFGHLADMTDEVFETLLVGIIKNHEESIQRAEAEKQERIAKEKAELEEKERIKAENEKLKKEAEAREAKAKKEREAADLKLKEERAKAEAERKIIEDKARQEREESERLAKIEKDKREKIEAELKARKDAEEKARLDAEAKIKAEAKGRELAEKKAKAAPDKAKLAEFAKSIDELLLPELKSEEAQKILSDAKTLLTKVSKFITEKTATI